MTKVINMLGGPCCGKSTVATHLFALMKLEGFKVELVTEFAKELVYAKSEKALEDQLLITATQNHRLRNLIGEVDYIITDTSLLNGAVYERYYGNANSPEAELARSLFNSYDNLNLLLPRKPQYDSYGRSQTAEQASYLDTLFREELGANCFNLTGVGDHKLIAPLILDNLIYKERVDGIVL